ncbi:(2Fe-2S)-binding protein [Bisbaumannia pacifica]|uniref:(2Fe-2S)-binding protein n=1 Tax=Bisbaumannia pacifica TaxID=77098 RepID=A0A510XGI2_9GAMM|nr:Rieske 2Fe-2S domain-containing protein [Halomonas pacifica]GEK48110.1 (2Fe-2S)-binding protein [Halomonas pacifica]
MSAIAHRSQLDATAALGLRLPDGREAFLVRVHGRISAFENRCPHQGIGLDFQPDVFLEPGGELIQCSMHGALFLPESGECVFGPCQGRHLVPVAIRIDDDGQIHLAE